MQQPMLRGSTRRRSSLTGQDQPFKRRFDRRFE
jgi:hypothetical protein